MDPDVALAEIRALVEGWNGDAPSENAYHLLMILTEQVEALDQWLSRGGFLPAAWDKRTTTWTLTADELDALREGLQDAGKLRISVDWGDLKWKIDESIWTAGKDPDRSGTTETKREQAHE